MKPSRGSVAATTLAKDSYCEQQGLLDKKHGNKRSKFVRERAKQGDQMHAQAHRDATPQSSSPCFVASCIYGSDAPETNFFRAFRDEHLQPKWWGRGFIVSYYAISPHCIGMINRHPTLKVALKYILNALLAVSRR